MEYVLSKDAQKQLESIEKRNAEIILNALDGLLEIPPRGDIKLIQGDKYRRFRLRVGRYRVIYSYGSDTKPLYVDEIFLRRDAYR